LVVKRWLFALAWGVAALSGCSVYNESLLAGGPRGSRDDMVGSDDDTPDAGADAMVGDDCRNGRCWWSEAQPDVCQSSGAPTPAQRPAANDDDDAAPLKDLYLAWFRTQLGEPTESLTWQQYGFDLDATCTNSATCRDVQDQLSCRGATARIPFDGELCRDNSFGSLYAIAAAMPELGDRFGLKHETVNCGLWRGDYSIVMRVSGYNGRANDAKVRLDLYAGAGLEAKPPWGCPVEDFDTRYPHWRQASAWSIDTAALRGEIETKGQLPDSNVHDAERGLPRLFAHAAPLDLDRQADTLAERDLGHQRWADRRADPQDRLRAHVPRAGLVRGAPVQRSGRLRRRERRHRRGRRGRARRATDL
jgi:hypothetical protein